MRLGSPSDAPSNESAPATTEVPLRCMPVTHTALDLIGGPRSGVRALAGSPTREVAPRLSPLVAVPGEADQEPQECAEGRHQDDRGRGVALDVDVDRHRQRYEIPGHRHPPSSGSRRYSGAEPGRSRWSGRAAGPQAPSVAEPQVVG